MNKADSNILKNSKPSFIFHRFLSSSDDHQYEGKRVLITYSAGHKGWFLRALKQREDIKVVELADMVPPEM